MRNPPWHRPPHHSPATPDKPRQGRPARHRPRDPKTAARNGRIHTVAQTTHAHNQFGQKTPKRTTRAWTFTHIGEREGRNAQLSSDGSLLGVCFCLVLVGIALLVSRCAVESGCGGCAVAAMPAPPLVAESDSSDSSSSQAGLDPYVLSLRRANDPIAASALDETGGVFLGGGLSCLGHLPLDYIGRWDGKRIEQLGEGVDDEVLTLVTRGSILYAGGRFKRAGGVRANGIAKWDGKVWSELGTGMNGAVHGLAWRGPGDLYAVGEFATGRWKFGRPCGSLGRTFLDAYWAQVSIDWPERLPYQAEPCMLVETSPSQVERWQGASRNGMGRIWTALSSGLDDSVNVILATGSKVYAAGEFLRARGAAARRIAVWDGASWAPLGKGIGGVLTRNGLTGTLGRFQRL